MSGLASLVGGIYVRLWSGELVVVVDWELLCLDVRIYMYVNMRSYKGKYIQGE